MDLPPHYYHRTIKTFCTPGSGLKNPAELDVGLYNHFKDSVEILDTDAAADERKAMRLLRDRSLNASAFKNCKATVRFLFASFVWH